MSNLYNKTLSNEESIVNISDKENIKKGISYMIQHPFIISKKILKYQKEEAFKYKIEETIKRMINKANIKGVLAEMPPEFDNKKMFKNTKKYLDGLNIEVIYLPGNSISNKKWIERISTELKTIFPNNRIHYYKHWKYDKEILDFKYEIKKLSLSINKNKQSIIFAKSLGVILAIKAIKDNLIKPKKCIFLGLPIKWAIKNKFELDEWIKDYNISTLFIQNNNDPFCNEKELKEFLKKNNVKNFRIVIPKGDNHDYEDYDLIRKEITNFL